MSKDLKFFSVCGAFALSLGLLAGCDKGSAPVADAGAPGVTAAAESGEPAEANASAKVENPMANAEVGDWVEYKMMGGMGQKWIVTDKTPDTVVYEVSTLVDGKPMGPSMPMTIPLNAEMTDADASAEVAAAEAPTLVHGKEDLVVGGKTLKCTTVAFTSNGIDSKTWTSTEVPLTGIVKSEMNGEIGMELVAYGRGK